MNAAARLWSGAAIAVMGVLSWALTLAVLEPAVKSGARAAPDSVEVGRLLLWPNDLRWSSMVLTLGGLLIALGIRVAIVASIPVWLVLDLTMELVGVEGWAGVGALMAGAGFILVAGIGLSTGVVAGRRFPRGYGNGPGVLVYCGVAAALTPLMFNVAPGTRDYRPAAMMVLAIVVSLGLAVSATLAALTAARPSGGRGVVVALGFALTAAAPAIVVQWWFAELREPGGWLVALPWACVPILLLGCVLLAKGSPATVLGWAATVVQAAVVIGLSFGLIWFGLVLSLLVRAEVVDSYDAYQIVVGGLVAGPFIGVVAMLGRRRPDPL